MKRFNLFQILQFDFFLNPAEEFNGDDIIKRKLYCKFSLDENRSLYYIYKFANPPVQDSPLGNVHSNPNASSTP